ncbi:MAG: hypothetical protein LBE50_02220 [Gallionellaceae bacterium]|jgi:hypothetical protein|nr:hypothetical protein [Gallionellaceae bacterium]
MRLSHIIASLLLITSAHAQAVDGVYVFGHEVETFQPCESSKIYWATGSRDVLKPLENKANNLRSMEDPYPSLFVEIVGHYDRAATSDDGFAEMYDGYFLIQEVLHVSTTIPSWCKYDGMAE